MSSDFTPEPDPTHVDRLWALRLGDAARAAIAARPDAARLLGAWDAGLLLPLGRRDDDDPLSIVWDVVLDGEVIVSVGMSELIAPDDWPL